MHASVPICMDIYIYYLFSNVFSSVHVSVYRSRGEQPAASTDRVVTSRSRVDERDWCMVVGRVVG